ncbi:hypothetical protein F4820DRAFT_467781 [Hypoxylon rubiginosum]|uniref:Uncharacterized protein n=1 Tax=Hypoxylon rubiginosum TaxID=110542 RepID=A0ACB9YHY5_9PEZI|nr:hypothetical protein F4820DRAFT_467781 [Hypoxylon rubiginosum]
MASQGSVMKKLVVGGRNRITLLTFNGTGFIITGHYEQQDLLPSPILFKEPNLLYVNNEEIEHIDVFRLGPDFSAANNSNAQSSARADASTVSDSLTKLFFDKPTIVYSVKGLKDGFGFEFNADKTRIVQTTWPSGEYNNRSSVIDVWDSSAADGSMRLLKRISNVQRHEADQPILDPTGRFFVLSSRHDTRILILDTNDDRYEVTSVIDLYDFEKIHFAFLTSDETTYLVVVLERTREVFVFEVQYDDDKIHLRRAQKQGPYGVFPPAAAACAVKVANNQRDVYVAMKADDRTDCIVHFTFRKEGGVAHLDYAGTTPSGSKPVNIHLSADAEQRFLYVHSWERDSGLVALRRDPETGALDPTPAAMMTNSEIPGAEIISCIVEI